MHATIADVIADTAQNSIEAGASKVELTLVEGGGRLAVTIRDDGKGMDAATVARAFDPFYTAPGKHANISWTAPKKTFQNCYFCVRIDQIDGNGDVVATSYSELFSADTVDSGATYIFLK